MDNIVNELNQEKRTQEDYSDELLSFIYILFRRKVYKGVNIISIIMELR